MTDESLEQKVEYNKSGKVSYREYAIVFALTEGLAYLGANAGVYLSDFLTRNKIIITGGTLAGDYIGGSLGVIISNWYNNKAKYRDQKKNFQYLRFLKDNLKLFVYDIPVVSISYAITSQATYQAVNRGWKNWAIAAVSSATMMTVWNTLNYIVYGVIKNDSDEKYLYKLISSLKSLYHKKSDNHG